MDLSCSTNCGSGNSSLPLLSCLLQTTLRSLCTQGTDWVYAVFWRILPRNYPPPKWDTAESILDRSSGNKRNWILVWEDGYCDFSACAKDSVNTAHRSSSNSNNNYNNNNNNNYLYYNQNQNNNDNNNYDYPCDNNANRQWSFLQPELFFKMSHEVYNFGEGVMGKIAADNSHRWFSKESTENETLSPSSWQGVHDLQPRTWEAQFRSGIETIAVVAVKEGLLQLGSLRKVEEDLNFVIFVQRKFNYLQNISTYYAITCSSSSSPTTTSTPPSFQQKDNNYYYYNNQCPLVPRKTHKENPTTTNISQKVDEEDEEEQLTHFEPTTSSGYLHQIAASGKAGPVAGGNNQQLINPSRGHVLANRNHSLPVAPRLGMPLYPVQQQNSPEESEAPYSAFWHDLMG